MQAITFECHNDINNTHIYIPERSCWYISLCRSLPRWKSCAIDVQNRPSSWKVVRGARQCATYSRVRSIFPHLPQSWIRCWRYPSTDYGNGRAFTRDQRPTNFFFPRTCAPSAFSLHCSGALFFFLLVFWKKLWWVWQFLPYWTFFLDLVLNYKTWL